MIMKYAVLNVSKNKFICLEHPSQSHTSDFETANAVFEDLVKSTKSEEYRLVKVESLN